jgi:hypothetical protein
MPGASRPWALRLAASRGERRGGLLEEGIYGFGFRFVIIIEVRGRINGDEGVGINLWLYDTLELVRIAASV